MMKKWGKALREKEMQIAIEQRKNPETVEISGFSGTDVHNQPKIYIENPAESSHISPYICRFTSSLL